MSFSKQFFHDLSSAGTGELDNAETSTRFNSLNQSR